MGPNEADLQNCALLTSVYAHFKTPALEPTYEGLVGAGGRLPIASVPKLDTYLTNDQPFVMIHGRNGFFSMSLYTVKADTVAWQVNGNESKILKFRH